MNVLEKTKTYDDLLVRCYNDPKEHLSLLSVDSFEAYLVGYELCCEEMELEFPIDPLNSDAIDDCIEKKYYLSDRYPGNQKKRAILKLFSSSEKEFYKKWIDLRADLNSKLDLKQFEKRAISKYTFEGRLCVDFPNINCQTLQLLLGGIQKKPAMYFGNRRSVESIWNLVQGYSWCMNDNDTKSSELTDRFNDFTLWVEERYPYSKGAPWYRTFELVALNSSLGSLERFYEDFTFFLGSESSDCL